MASAKGQEMVSINRLGLVGKSDSGCHTSKVTLWGILTRTNNTIGQAKKLPKMAISHWYLSRRGRSKCKMTIATGVSKRRKIAAKASIWIGL